MKTLFNKFMMAMVAVVMVIGFSAFKAAKTTKVNNRAQWHSVIPHSSNPDLDLIGVTTDDEYEDGTCFDFVLDERCSVRITLPNENYDPVGKTIEEFLADGGMIDAETYKFSASK